MTPEELHRKTLIKHLVDHPDFKQIIRDIQWEMCQEMMTNPDVEVRTALFNENKGLERLMGKLTSIANEVRMTNAA